MSEPSSAPASWRSSSTYLLVVLSLVNTVNWADRQVVPILFPGIREELGLSDTELGIIGGVAFSLVYAVSAFIFGYLADRRVRRNLIAIGLVMWSAATAVSGLATGFWTLFAARFFTGIGEASLFPAGISLIVERFPGEGRGRAVGIFGAATAVGGGLGLGLGGPLAEAMGWRFVFFLYGGVGLLLFPFVMLITEAPRTTADDGGFATTLGVVRETLRDRRLTWLWAAGVVMLACGVGYGAWVPSFFVRFRDLDVASAGVLFGLSQLVGGIGGALLGGYFADRWSKRRPAGEIDVCVVAALVSVPTVACVLIFEHPAVYLTLGALGPVAIFSFFPSIQVAVAGFVPAHRHGITFAIQSFFMGGLGSAIGPTLIGRVSDVTGSIVTALWVPVFGMAAAAWLSWKAGNVARLQPPGLNVQPAAAGADDDAPAMGS